MTTPKRLLIAIGTRPEAIKLAPVALAAVADPDRFDVHVVRTSQHQQMLDQVVDHFGLPIHDDLDLMRPNQTLVHITMAVLDGITRVIDKVHPDVVVVQGDTTTTYAAGLAAFYRHIPVAHVEAGLRTDDLGQPFPEEANRRLVSVLADHNFAPTTAARDNLIRENVPASRVWVTGNTAIDALRLSLRESRSRPCTATKARTGAQPGDPRRTILVTAHRRENHGEPLRRICEAIVTILERFPDVDVLYPMHMSPKVRGVVEPMLGGHPRVALVEPLGYAEFVEAMDTAHLILSDSGGVQEEAPALGKPVLVLRGTTERPEAVKAGAARLVGTDIELIVKEVEHLLTDPGQYRAMSQARQLFGDGHAAERILDVLADA